MLTSDNFRCGCDQHGVSASLPPPGPPQPHRNHQNPPELNIQTCQTRWDYDYNTKSIIRILRKYIVTKCVENNEQTQTKRRIFQWATSAAICQTSSASSVNKWTSWCRWSWKNGSCLNIIYIIENTLCLMLFSRIFFSRDNNLIQQ